MEARILDLKNIEIDRYNGKFSAGVFRYQIGGFGPVWFIPRVAGKWKDLDFEGRPERDSRAIRVCDWKIAHLVEHAKMHRDGNPDKGIIFWIHHQEVGAWLVEALGAAGLRGVTHAKAGDNEKILDPRVSKNIVVASIDAHGTGKNLQAFEHMAVVQWPRSARVAEQLIGRLHRRGQQADELVIRTCNTLPFDQMNFAACLNDALYIHQSTGDRQKLIYASYDPVPKIFPHHVMVANGLEVEKLTAEQERMLKDKFGDYTGVPT